MLTRERVDNWVEHRRGSLSDLPDLLVNVEALAAVLGHEEAVLRGTSDAIEHARRRLADVAERLPALAACLGVRLTGGGEPPRFNSRRATSSPDECMDIAASWLAWDPLLGLELALLLAESSADSVLTNAQALTLAALACRAAGLGHRAVHHALHAADLSLRLSAHDANDRAILAYRCATAVDIALKGLFDADRAGEASVLIERARRRVVPSRPVSRGSLDVRAMAAPVDAVGVEVDFAVDGALDLCAAAERATGCDGAWWWGVRLSESGGWCSLVRPNAPALLRPVAPVVKTLLAQVESKMPLGVAADVYDKRRPAISELSEANKEVWDRLRRGPFGSATYAAPEGLHQLLPLPLAEASTNSTIVDLAVSLPSTLHHVPLGAYRTLAGDHLLEVARPVMVMQTRPCAAPAARPSEKVVWIRGDDGGLSRYHALAHFRVGPSLTRQGAIEKLVGAHGQTVVVSGHVEANVYDLEGPADPSSIDGFGLCFSDLPLAPSDIRGFSKAPWCVLLVGCRSAGRAAGASDEWVGLGPAFLDAGARWVIAAQWPVPVGDATAEFLAELLAALEKYEPPEALRVVQSTRILNGTPDAYAWLPWAVLA